MDDWTYLIITWIITSHLESFYRHNWLFVTHHKIEVDEPHRNWRITAVQSECKTELSCDVLECIFYWKKRQSKNVSNLVMRKLKFIHWNKTNNPPILNLTPENITQHSGTEWQLHTKEAQHPLKWAK